MLKYGRNKRCGKSIRLNGEERESQLNVKLFPRCNSHWLHFWQIIWVIKVFPSISFGRRVVDRNLSATLILAIDSGATRVIWIDLMCKGKYFFSANNGFIRINWISNLDYQNICFCLNARCLQRPQQLGVWVANHLKRLVSHRSSHKCDWIQIEKTSRSIYLCQKLHQRTETGFGLLKAHTFSRNL